MEKDLPSDVILTIFSKLPLKALCRCKSLSKFYSSPEALNLVNKRRPKIPFDWLIEDGINDYNEEFSDEESDEDEMTVPLHYSMDYTGVTRRINIYKVDVCQRLRYCDGLIMCLFSTNELRVINLTTLDDAISLPEWCDEFEFYFDPYSRKYKVLGWRIHGDDDPMEFRVLTLERDYSWKPVNDDLGIVELPESSIAAGGKLFWKFDFDDEDEQLIISFEMENQIFYDICLPEELRPLTKEDFRFSLFEMEDCLGLVEQRAGEAPMFNLWIMKDYMDTTNKWILIKRNLSLPFNMIGYYPKHGETWTIVHSEFSYRNEEIIITTTNKESIPHVFIYSLVSGQVKTLCPSELPHFLFEVKNYVENTIRLKDFITH